MYTDYKPPSLLELRNTYQYQVAIFHCTWLLGITRKESLCDLKNRNNMKPYYVVPATRPMIAHITIGYFTVYVNVACVNYLEESQFGRRRKELFLSSTWLIF